MQKSRLAAFGGIAALTLGVIGGSLAWTAGTATAAPAPAPQSAAKTFAVDLVHSSLLFRIKHMNVANFYGTINEFSGSFTMGETFSCEITAKAESVDSRNEKRDAHIRNPDFFSAKEFPEMKFVAKDIKMTGDTFSGKGDLTFRGVTKPVDVEFKKVGVGAGRGGGEIAGVDATFTFKRSDFGNDKMIGPLSDEVMIIVGLEGASK